MFPRPAVSADWTLFDSAGDMSSYDVDNMFNLDNCYPESAIGDVDILSGEGQQAPAATGNVMNFPFESLVSFPDDDAALGV